MNGGLDSVYRNMKLESSKKANKNKKNQKSPEKEYDDLFDKVNFDKSILSEETEFDKAYKRKWTEFDDEKFNFVDEYEKKKYDNLFDKVSFGENTLGKKTESDDENFSFGCEYDKKKCDDLFDKVSFDGNILNEETEFDKAYKGKLTKYDDDNFNFDDEYKKSFTKQSKDRIDNTLTEQKNESDSPPQTAQEHSAYFNSMIRKKSYDDGGKKYLPLTIAEDFVMRKDLLIVKNAIYIYNDRFYKILTEDNAQQLIFDNYKESISHLNLTSIVNQVSLLLKRVIKTRLDEFPINKNLIVFQNGTLEVDTGHFRKNSARDLANSALGIEYDPQSWEMPHTKYFLETIADGDEALYERMLQVIGYILTNDLNGKSFIYLEGKGDAGKSKFCDLLASFFPKDGANKVARIALQDLGNKYSVGNLVNTKLNISEDLPDEPLSKRTVSRIKMLSDGNLLEADMKYVQPFVFKPTAKFLFASNHQLRLKEYDKAFVNRVVYIPFFNSIPKHKQDKNILEKMQGELSALFNHAFAAYKRFVSNNYIFEGAERFQPDICIRNSDIKIDKERVIRDFIDQCCVFDKEAITATEDLKIAYIQYCNEYGHIPIVGDRFSREFFANLPDVVKKTKISNQKRGYEGIRLKQDNKIYE